MRSNLLSQCITCDKKDQLRVFHFEWKGIALSGNFARNNEIYMHIYISLDRLDNYNCQQQLVRNNNSKKRLSNVTCASPLPFNPPSKTPPLPPLAIQAMQIWSFVSMNSTEQTAELCWGGGRERGERRKTGRKNEETERKISWQQSKEKGKQKQNKIVETKQKRSTKISNNYTQFPCYSA